MRQSQHCAREEALAILCSLIITGTIAYCLLLLEESEGEDNNAGMISGYEELVPDFPSRFRPRAAPTRRREGSEKPEAKYATVMVKDDSSVVMPADSTRPPRSSSPGNVQPHNTDPATTTSLVFREHTNDAVLDSIFRSDSTTRQALLLQHLLTSTAVYDTASVMHFLHLANDFRRFYDKPVTLEEAMRREMRRTGHPYDPTRPQSPSPQLPLGGALFWLLGKIF